MLTPSRLALALSSTSFFLLACNAPPPAAPLPPAGMAGAPAAPAAPAPMAASLPTALPGAGAPAVDPTQPELPPGHPPIGSAMPAAAPQGGNEPVLTGVVQETMDVPEYTYMRVQKADKTEEWVAVTRTSVKKGDTVQVSQSIVMPNFSSKTLGRTFPRLVMGSLVGTPTPAGSPPPKP